MSKFWINTKKSINRWILFACINIHANQNLSLITVTKLCDSDFKGIGLKTLDLSKNTYLKSIKKLGTQRIITLWKCYMESAIWKVLYGNFHVMKIFPSN